MENFEKQDFPRFSASTASFTNDAQPAYEKSIGFKAPQTSTTQSAIIVEVNGTQWAPLGELFWFVSLPKQARCGMKIEGRSMCRLRGPF